MSKARLNVLRVFLILVVGIPVGLFAYLRDHDVPPDWVSVTLILGYPVLFLVFLVVGVWAVPPQRPSVGVWFLMRHFKRW